MRAPTETEIETIFLAHYAAGYDPVAAKEYYERTKKLKGRRKKPGEQYESGKPGNKITEDDPRWKPSSRDPRTGKTREQIAKDARARQRKELGDQIKRLDERIDKLDALIKEREAEAKKSNQKSEAKKERAAKEAAKPDSAAEKAEKARDAEKYRDKNQQKLKGKDDKKSGGGSSGSKKKGGGGKKTVSELRTFRTKLKGQVAIAKQKLAAL
jgi:hypothetical protein